MASECSIRALAKDLVDGRTSRRRFVATLVGAGVLASVARVLAQDVTADSSGGVVGEFIEGSGGEVMARALEAADVKYVFGIPGTDEVGFVDALVDHSGMQYILGLHEGPLAAMADGYAKVSGRPAFVNVHTIAGTANALGQVVNSSLDGTPIVLTAGNQDSRLRGRGSFLESPRLETLPQDYTKWRWDVMRADSIPDMLRRAFKIATTPPFGPVFLTFSKDIWKQPQVRAELLPQSRFTVTARLAPDPVAIEQAAKLLLRAQNPLLLAGDEIAKYGGRRYLVELAELLGAPVVGELTTGHGRITFPTRHPQYLGLFPGQKHFPLPIDLLFNAGGRMFSEFDYQPEPVIARQVRTIHLSMDTTNLARTYPLDVALIADPESGLRALVERVKAQMTTARRAENRGRVQRIAEARAPLEQDTQTKLKRQWNSQPISGERLAAELDRALDTDAIVVTETVTSDSFVADYIHFNNGDPGRTHLASHGGNLGWGIGAACGAKLAAPRREVALLSGDGSFQFGIQGLWTAARYEIPVLFVIWNNANYQSNRLALAQYGRRALETGRYIGTFLGDPEIDHVAIGRGYGVEGARVHSAEDVRAALEQALNKVRQGKPFVLDVAIQRRFPGADARWHEKFSVAEMAQQSQGPSSRNH